MMNFGMLLLQASLSVGRDCSDIVAFAAATSSLQPTVRSGVFHPPEAKTERQSHIGSHFCHSLAGGDTAFLPQRIHSRRICVVSSLHLPCTSVERAERLGLPDWRQRPGG